MYNRICLIGRLGKDPERRVTQNGVEMTTFSIAVDQYFKGETKTEWFKIVTYSNLAHVCNQFLVKGRMVYVEGTMFVRSYQSNHGEFKAYGEVVASQVVFLSGKNKYAFPDMEGDKEPHPQQAQLAQNQWSYEKDDVPF